MNIKKTLALFCIDLAMLVVAFALAYFFRFDFDFIDKIDVLHASYVLILSIVVYMSLFFIFKMHKIIWRYASLLEMIQVAKSVFVGFIGVEVLSFLIFGLHYIPLSILPLQAFFYLSLIVASRAFYRIFHVHSASDKKSQKVLLIGGGQAGDGLLRDMLQDPKRSFDVVGILDDDAKLQGRVLRGVRVLGGIDLLEESLSSNQPDMVIYAIPSIANPVLLNKVYNACEKVKVPLRVLPGLSHLVQGRVNIDALKKVDIEDLLGREPVKLIHETLMNKLSDKVVLVTGAGGSIGSELCRQIAMNKPRSLSLVDNNEYHLFTCHAELIKKFPDLDITLSLSDVSQKQEIASWFEKVKPNVVFHAAAYKHVPMLETQVIKAIKNNVLGTQNVADLSDEFGVETFVLVSSDKAVNPTNVMGTTKRLAEIYCQTKNTISQTHYITVRFGNVLGSNGSVLPLFRKQLAAGGPLTVTHPDMTRYFMMIPEAVTLILQSYLLGKGGEIFVLEMGEPIKIVDLAEKLISLSGQVPYQDIDIQFTGIRPGEKLFEEIFHDAENMTRTDHQQILIANCREYQPSMIKEKMAAMADQCALEDEEGLLNLMLELVPEYKRANAQ